MENLVFCKRENTFWKPCKFIAQIDENRSENQFRSPKNVCLGDWDHMRWKITENVDNTKGRSRFPKVKITWKYRLF